MKYSLRSLMIVVTLVCVVFGGRVEYLRRWAVFHETEAEQLATELATTMGWSRQSFDEIISTRPPIQKCDMWMVLNHRKLGEEYRAAMIRPWKTVIERDSPDDTYATYLRLRPSPHEILHAQATARYCQDRR
jgi:hypothetical protein